LRRQVEAFQYNLLAPLFALNLVLRDPPRYRVAESRPELAQAFMVILGLDHVDQFHDIVRHHEAGTIPTTVMWGACPTLFDPSQAPPGGHTAFMWEKLPYRLHGDPANWDAAREQHLLVGAFSNGQIGFDRPFPGAGSYRAHVPGLYLCGSSSHPGGNITGLPGYNAAQVVLSDLGISTDWAPPALTERLAAL
jgi:phytoene dehydrogenase-like protein